MLGWSWYEVGCGVGASRFKCTFINGPYEFHEILFFRCLEGYLVGDAGGLRVFKRDRCKKAVLSVTRLFRLDVAAYRDCWKHVHLDVDVPT